MSLARVQNFSISLDGYGTGEDLTLEAPFGHAGHRLHEWMFATSFGHQQVMGVLTPADAEPAIPDGFSIRPPELDDIDQLIRVDVALPQHQAAAPVFSGVAPWQPTVRLRPIKIVSKSLLT